MKLKHAILSLIALSVIFIVACEKTSPGAPDENEILDGPMEGLTHEQNAQFLSGDAAFSEVFTTTTGLGPTFVSTSCVSCHAGDGKGHPFTSLVRFGQADTSGNKFLNHGGPQLQSRAIPGYQPEQIPSGATSSTLLPPAVTGLGLLDAVSDADLIALADPNDIDGDGISGIPNWNNIPDYITLRPNAISKNGKYICRIGKKGAAYDLLHQTVNAYNQDMGITSEFDLIDPYSGLHSDPEVTTNTINDVVAYLKTLKAPIPRDEDKAEVIAGKQIFSRIGCDKCHTPTLKTGPSPIAAIANVEFHPYTDLLLHDMGTSLDDNYTEGFALTSEWRTPPLWGLGLSKDAQGGEYFLMHDGRARSIPSAIQMHDGEGKLSSTAYSELSENEKSMLIDFLESL